MDGWNSEWVIGDPNDHQENVSPTFNKTTACYSHEGNTVDSPNVSKDDSIESCSGDHIDKSDNSITKPTFKSIQQAKKRLQAFSATKQLKRNSSKDEKTDDLEKSDKISPKKSKKALYPLDKAQAVVQEIEEIKQKEAEEAQQEQKKIDAIMAVAYKTLALKEAFRVRSRSSSTEREQQFKKREIKSRNYRRSDSFKRRSPSPENCSKRVGKLIYPRNWVEYKQQGLTLVKDEELKSKVFPKTKHNSHELVAKFLTFDGPSPLIDSFKSLTLEEKAENVPMSFLRITRSKPTLLYSVNNKKNKDSFLTRKQLFHIIPRDRRGIIEKLINSASSRSQFQSRTLTSRPWYVKSWRKSADAECKILENSVGLSFLQTYSDEEEENETEEIITGNIVKESNTFLELKPSIIEKTSRVNEEIELSINERAIPDKSRREVRERETLTPEEKPMAVQRKQKEEESLETKASQKEESRKHQNEELKRHSREKEQTPEKIKNHSNVVKPHDIKCQKENILEGAKKKEKDELNETRRAIKELEEELERRKALRIEEERESKKEKKKKKKIKKKEVSSESEEEVRSSKKKKKKIKLKKKKYVSDGEESSSDNDRSKKNRKKTKRKKEKVAKKKEKCKKIDSSTKEHKMIRREDDSESSGEEEQKKKRTSEADEFESLDFDEVGKKVKKKLTDKNKERSNMEDPEDSEVKKKKLFDQDEEGGKKKLKSNQACRDFLEDIQLFNDYQTSNSPTFLKEVKEREGKSESLLILDNNTSTTPGRNDKEHLDEREVGNVKSPEHDIWRNEKEKDSTKSMQDSELLIKSDEGTKRKKEFDNVTDEKKVSEKLKDRPRQREELKHKTEIDLERTDIKQSTRRDKSEGDDKISKNRRVGEDSEKKYTQRERGNSKERRQGAKSEKQKETRYCLEAVAMKDEPDWENLRSKRNKHRHSDNLYNEFRGFPLEKDCGKLEIGTPDTEDYRENWEKDSYPIWESEDEAPTKTRQKLNNSWESDEEIFERGHQVTESVRPLSDTLDLEIPLNIKPFKRREIVDPDMELQLLKKQSLSLSEERRKLEIEKLRVKELELEVIKEAEDKAEEGKKMKRRRSKDDEVEVEDTGKSTDSARNANEENEVVFLKRGRWDKKMSLSKTSCVKSDVFDITHIKKEITDDEDSSTNVSSTTSVNTSAVLENEYEEFMKALTSSPKKPQVKNRAKKDETNSDNSCSISESTDLDRPLITTKSTDSQIKVQIIDSAALKETDQQPPVSQVVTILPKDIPLIPMPLPKTEIKPVPVPSPQIEMDKIPKPLINLSLSASITLDIAPKFTTPPTCSPSTSTNSLKAMIMQSPTAQDFGKFASESGGGDIPNFASPLRDTSLDSVKEKANEREEGKSTNKPFVFTSMVLPSKRQLLNNSNLNLGDSDDEEKHVKPLKKLDDLMKENKNEPAKTPVDRERIEVEMRMEPELEKSKETEREVKRSEKKETAHARTPQDRDGKRKRSPERHVRREGSPKRSFHGKRELSPRRRGRESPPRRRGHSPKRHSPRRRSPIKRRSPGKRRHSPRRSASPKSRRRSSISPRRKATPRRSPTPKFRSGSPKKLKSKSPDRHSSAYKPSSDRSLTNSNKPKSPTAITSPMEGLKRSVADSTISDDLLLQPGLNMEEYNQSPVTHFYDRTAKPMDSPKRESLDMRINQALGLTKEEPQPIPTTYSNYGYGQFSQQAIEPKSNLVPFQQTFGKVTVQQSKSNFVQVGNMVQILPTEDIPMIHVEKMPLACPINCLPPGFSQTPRPVLKSEKSQIVQVGNMLQIVPADLPPVPPLPPTPKMELDETAPYSSPPLHIVQEKQSAESAMRLKVAERREEREKRRQEREKRRKEKEKRRKEKERQRQIRLKQRTENMIKRALELEVEGTEEEAEPVPTETPTQWPPPPAPASSAVPPKEAGKGILVRASGKGDPLKIEKRKVVQFADGVKPGEGTSPSGGEELSSPPPRRKLPKEKRYKKTKLQKKNLKKKIKVKIIKKRPETEESDDDDDALPPPSPPPGSPPPHIFPPRLKPQPINNIQPYLSNVVPIQTGHSQQQLYRPAQLNLIMHPHHGPPHPPHHHGPPPPPPHHHPHHHGPPLPPGPPHFHHGPPPPPPHHGPPPPGVGRPRIPLVFRPFRPRPPHHHHGPPPPFHR